MREDRKSRLSGASFDDKRRYIFASKRGVTVLNLYILPDNSVLLVLNESFYHPSCRYLKKWTIGSCFSTGSEAMESCRVKAGTILPEASIVKVVLLIYVFSKQNL